MSLIVEANPLVLILQNFKKRVTLKVFDSDEQPADASEVELTVQQLDGSTVYQDAYVTPPTGGGRIKKSGTGVYYLSWGDPGAAANTPTQTETLNCGKYLFVWTAYGPEGTEEEQVVQTVEVISAATLDCLRAFRQQLDKGIKDVSVDPADFCPLGYTEGMLLEYLRGGMYLINAYQPYPTFCDLAHFTHGRAACFKQTLFDAGMIVAVNAQTLFAIDSDLESWSDQGNSWVLNHTPKLAAFNAALSQRLDKIIPQMKLHFVNSGSVKTEVGPSFRLNTLVQMSPNGATFRNVFTR